LLSINLGRISLAGVKFNPWLLSVALLTISSAIYLGECSECSTGLNEFISSKLWIYSILTSLAFLLSLVVPKGQKIQLDLICFLAVVAFVATVVSPILQILSPQLCIACLLSYTAFAILLDNNLTIDVNRRLASTETFLVLLIPFFVLGISARSPYLGSEPAALETTDLVGKPISSIGRFSGIVNGVVSLKQYGCHWCQVADAWISSHSQTKPISSYPCSYLRTSNCWIPREVSALATPTFLVVKNGKIVQQVEGWGSPAEQLITKSPALNKKNEK